MKIIECPRDAMQGIKSFIPSTLKLEYLKKLLEVGFDTLDFGSFVSPKAIPQMADTLEISEALKNTTCKSKLLVIVANERGAQDACAFDHIHYLGFPLSVSETFQQRNTNSGIEDSIERLRNILIHCQKHKKELVVYLSMGFGNPYGDPWSPEIVAEYAHKLDLLGIKIIALADTVGVARTEDIFPLFEHLITVLPGIEWGAHLHTRLDDWYSKVEAAWEGGCRRFDSAIKGYGGCPMAKDELVGNLSTENLIGFVQEKGVKLDLNMDLFKVALDFSDRIFLQHA